MTRVPLRFGAERNCPPIARPEHVTPSPIKSFANFERIAPANLSHAEAEALIERCATKFQRSLRYLLVELMRPINNQEIHERYQAFTAGIAAFAGDAWKANLNHYFSQRRMGYRIEQQRFPNGMVFYELWRVREKPPNERTKRERRSRT